MAESEIETHFVKQLERLKYVYRDDINNLNDLELNFRRKFDVLNDVILTDGEFARLLEQITDEDVFASSKHLRTTNYFKRDDDTPLDYSLVNTKDWCKNDYECIRQLRINTRNSHHRYDIILLINGIPVVQVELKNHDTDPRCAMQQIVQYKKDAGNSYTDTLMCFIQFFIVSNGNKTQYFANNIDEHFKFDDKEQFLPIYQWADERNKKIPALHDFANDFLRKCTLGETISRYMVLVESERKLIMMRPYQIYAVKEIVNRVSENSGNGYIWHTTGSGKTLTSFKAATLLKNDPNIHKCLFVVDRKDLDEQTRNEFNRFQLGCVEDNKNTRALVQNLCSTDYSHKVIVTTIQKLALALNSADKKKYEKYKELLEPLSKERMVFIFDECHRSQFGKNHKAIKDFFPNAQMFGFTGTPIFPENSTAMQIVGEEGAQKTTKDIFQKCLHTYTISDAIEDKTVLPFLVEYYGTDDDASRPKKATIVGRIIDKNNDGDSNHHKTTAERNFNALFATSSINDAIDYYNEFKKAQEGLAPHDRLNIACVFSPPTDINEDLPQESTDTINPRERKKELCQIIDDYNETFGSNHKFEEFDDYYRDIQQRIKNQDRPKGTTKKIDITIVVDMLLTGFDAKYLNTLYVDKNLRHHSLIQAFSRTNRILNSTKGHGKIINFRNQHDELNEAIEMFSHPDDRHRAKEIWLVESADKKIPRLREAKEDLVKFMDSRELDFTAEGAANIKGKLDKIHFIEDFKKLQRVFVQLDQYTDLDEEQKAEIEEILPKETHLALKTHYLDFVKELREQDDDEGGTHEEEEIQFDPELILLASYEIDYDYIMALWVENSGTPERMEVVRERLIGLIRSNSNLVDERELLVDYVNTLELGKRYTKEEIDEGYDDYREWRIKQEVEQIADKHKLNLKGLEYLIDDILQNRVYDDTMLTNLLEPLELKWRERLITKKAIMHELKPLLERRAGDSKISGLGVYYLKDKGLE